MVSLLIGAMLSIGSVSSDWEHAKDQYSPPMMANGDVCGLFDYRNMMFQDYPSYNFIKCTGGLYRPSIYREKRRMDNLQLACFGRIEERVVTAEGKVENPTWWKQSLDVFGAVSQCENRYANGLQIDSEAIIHFDRPLIAISKRFTGKVREYAFDYLLCKAGSQDEKSTHFTYSVKGDTLEYTIEKYKDSIHGKVRLFCSAAGAKIVPTERGLTAIVENPQGEVTFALAFADDADGEERLPEAFDWAEAYADHLAKWRAWMGRTYVKVPDETIQRVYDTSLYTLKCWSTKWSIPVGILPMHWNGAFFGFTFFGPALCATDHEADMRKVAQYWCDTIPEARKRASRAYPNDPSTGIRWMWLPEETGRETCGNGRWLDHINHMGTICKEAINCWWYNEDRQFLEKTIYPILKGSAEFYDHQAVYETADGKTIIGKCCDLERMQSPVSNPFLTTCAAIRALESASEAAEVLKVDADMSQHWREVARRLRRDLPHDKEKYIPYPNYDVRSVAVLGGLIPYETHDRFDALQRAAVYDFEENALEAGGMMLQAKRVCTWYSSWTANALARLGDGEHAYKTLAESASTSGKFGEIFEVNEPGFLSIPWCSSPQGTFVQAVNEMLLQCKGDDIYVAPAVPKAWKDFSFKLKAYDDVMVEVEFKDGKCVKSEMTPGKKSSGRQKRLHIGFDKVEEKEDEWVWTEAKDFGVEGRPFNTGTDAPYARFPASLKGKVPEWTYGNMRMCSGMTMGFSVDDDEVRLRAEVEPATWKFVPTDYYMTAFSQVGFDWYERDTEDGEWVYANHTAVRDNGATDEVIKTKPGRQILVNFPMRAVPTSVKIGVKKGKKLTKLPKHRFSEKPIVHYGTSIVHGGCISRPGLNFTAQAARKLDVEWINLGLQGAARMEFPICTEALAKIDASLYIIDPLWNMDMDMVKERYEKFVRELRRLRPDTPILLCEDVQTAERETEKGRFARALYERLLKEGWKGLYLLKTDEILPNDTDLTLDRCHPNEAGAKILAKVYGDKVRAILGK